MKQGKDEADRARAPDIPLPCSPVEAEGPAFWRGRLERSFREGFGRTFWPFFVLAVASGAACLYVEGRTAFLESLQGDLRLLVEILPRIAAALLIAGFVQVLIPRDAVAGVLGEEAGVKGVAIAAAAGSLTPGGPMTSFPVVNAIHAAGAGRSSLVAYLTSWSVLGLQRILAWEIPLLGIEFAAIRFVASLPLPFAAAAVSKFIPFGYRAAGTGDSARGIRKA